MKHSIRHLIVRGLLVIAAAVSCSPASAAAFPDKPIRLIVGSAPGTGPDISARLLGERLAALLGQPVVVDNRPGASGTIAMTALAKSPADGYTLGLLNMPLVVAPLILPHVPYDTERDLQPVTQVNRNHFVLAVRAASPYRSLQELVDAARAQPGRLKYASTGNGTPGHLAFKLLEQASGIELLHVPYRGSPATVTALLAGEVDVLAGLPALAPHIADGTLRPLAALTTDRLPGYPSLPTARELGYPTMVLNDWQGIVAPVGTPRAIVDQLASAVAQAVAQPDLRARFDSLSMSAAPSGPDEFTALIRNEISHWQRVVRDANIKAD